MTERAKGTDQGWLAAARLFGGALANDAASPDRWSEFGDALAQTNDNTKAEYCFLRAVDLAPNSPRILLNIGDFYSNIRQPRKALPYFRKILTLTDDQEYNERVFSYYHRMEVSLTEILEAGIPDRRAAQANFQWLLAEGDLKASETVWKWMASRDFIDAKIAAGYAQLLVQKGQFEQAARVWAANAGACDAEYLKTTQVYNGDFECELTSRPLDWRIEAVDGVEGAIDPAAPHAGSASLRLRFDGQHNVDYRQVLQDVFVTPGEYVLEAWIRCDGITTDEGIGVRVSGLGPPLGEVATETQKGTTGWTKVTKTFAAPSKPGLVQVQIFRRASLRFDNLIAGTAWVDSVAIRRK